MRFWTKAFWKDAFERVTATAVESLLGIMLVTGFDLDNLLSWTGVWKGVVAISLVALLKTVLAGLKNPNSGASFGTTIPADFVHAMETQMTVEPTKDDGFVIGPESKPGDIVAGPGARQATDSPVVVQAPPLPPPAT